VASPIQTIGVISDTHGLLRPEAIAALRGSDLIVHAGDVGDPNILVELKKIAPVVAVRGNVDRDAWANRLPQAKTIDHADVRLYVLHIIDELVVDPAASGIHAVISGHTHQPKIKTKNGVLYFNPGSAGPRRFNLPISLGRLVISEGKLTGEIVDLSV